MEALLAILISQVENLSRFVSQTVTQKHMNMI